jgi:putative ABC transport system permease protein
MSFTLLQGTLELGLIYSLVALGLYLSFRILDIADLTVDGGFTLGCATSGIATLAGHPFLGLLLALFAGSLAGLVTALLQTKLKVQSILAGIITMTALYSINLMVMGSRANLPLLKSETIYSIASKFLPSAYSKLIVISVIVLVVVLAMYLFLKSATGLAVRATGDNPDLVRSSSINPNVTITIGLCIANAIVSLSGALLAQYQLFAEITTGTGMVVIGLASLIIGEAIIGRGGIFRCLIGALVGSGIYRLIIAFAITTSLSASNLKLISAIIVAISISWPAIKEKIEVYKLKKASRQ